MIPLFEQLFRAILAVVLGGIIGFERERWHKPAGLRTNMLVCLGSALTVLVSQIVFNADIGRVAAGIITGVGFLGAGAIIGSENKVHGLTTAATIWVVAAIGICVGAGQYMLSLVGSLLILFILMLGRLELFAEEIKKKRSSK